MHDVVVVGAGPAGSVAALRLRRDGASVLLLDRVPFPRWKVCGACIGPTAASLLAEIGVLDRVEVGGARPLPAMDLWIGRRRFSVPLRGNLAFSRARLDGILLEEAQRSGARVRTGVQVTDLRLGDDGVELRTRCEGARRIVRARVVVDATGLGFGLGDSRAGRAGDPGLTVAEGSRVGLGAVFSADGASASAYDGWLRTAAMEPGRLAMMVGASGYAGCVGVEDGSLNVAASVDRSVLAAYGPEGAVHRILAESGCEGVLGSPTQGWRGTPALTRKPREVAGRRIFRIGDAAGYVEPFTGEGIGWAMSTGVGVAPFALAAVDRWDASLAEGWTRAHRRAIRRRQRLCRILAAGLRRPGLVRFVGGLLALAPRLAQPIVRATGASPPFGSLEEAVG